MSRLKNRSIHVPAQLAAAAALTLIANGSIAAILSWDADGTSPVNGGSGNWNTTDLIWYDGANYVAWNNAAGDVASFGNTAGTVTVVGSGVSAAGLTFNASSSYTLSGGPISLTGAGTVSVTGSEVVSNASLSGTNFAKTGTGRLRVNGGFTFSNVDLQAGELRMGNGTLGNLTGSATYVNLTSSGNATLHNTANTEFAGTLTANTPDRAGIVKTGSGTLSLTGAGFLGERETIINGGRLVLAGASTILNSEGTSGRNVFINSGTALVLDNRTANNNNRIVNVTSVQLSGGELQYLGSDAVASSETAASLIQGIGDGTLTIDTGASQNATLTFANYSRANRGVTFVRGTNLGSAAAGGTRVLFTAAPTLIGGGGADGTTTVSIAPHFVGASGTTAAAPTGFVTYGAQGLRLLTASEYATSASAAGAQDNVRLASADAIAGPATVNSLVLATGGDLSGAGTLTVSSGAVLVDGGSLSANLDFGAVEGILTYNADATYSGTISGSNGLTKAGVGKLTLNTSSPTGTVTVSGGELVLAAAASGRNLVANGAPLTVNANQSGSGTIDVNGGTLTVGASLPTGTFTINNGTIQSADAAGRTFSNAVTLGGNLTTAGSGNITFQTGAVSVTGARTITVNNTQTSFNGNLTDGGNNTELTKSGSGTLVLGGALDLDVGLTINAGTVRLSGSNKISDGDTLEVNANGTFNHNGFFETVGSLVGSGTVDGGAAAGFGTVRVNTSGTPTFSGLLTGKLNVSKDGTGTWTISGAANDFTGNTEIRQGTIKLGATNALAATSTLTLGNSGNSGVLDLNGFSQTLTGIATTGTGTGNSVTSTSAATLTVNQATDQSFGGNLTGAGLGLTKSGAGKLTLTGASNTYGGATNVIAGQLIVNGSAVNSAVTLTGGSLGGSGTVGSIAGGAGSVDPGNSPGILTAASVNPAGGTDFNFEFTAVGSPTYSSATASGNDVLRLTGVTPFAADLGAGNVISVYLDDAVDGVGAGDVFVGGFYADQLAGFDSQIADATFAFYYRDAAGGISYGGNSYSALGLPVTVSTIGQSADFGGGSINGSVTQFTVVPEPGHLALLAAAALPLARRRRA